MIMAKPNGVKGYFSRGVVLGRREPGLSGVAGAEERKEGFLFVTIRKTRIPLPAHKSR
jgi:hypothetical protein